MDFPSAAVARPVISTCSLESILFALVGIAKNGMPGPSAWSASNRAVYTPFQLSAPFVVRRLWWANGATVSGNVDAGIYALDGTRIVSIGSTAQAGANVVQSVSVTTFILTPDSYYFALSCDNTTATFQRLSNITSSAANQIAGNALQNSAFPLPSSATFATVSGGGASSPVMGMTSRTLI